MCVRVYAYLNSGGCLCVHMMSGLIYSIYPYLRSQLDDTKGRRITVIESETVDILISYVKDPFSSGAEAKQKAGKKKFQTKKQSAS